MMDQDANATHDTAPVTGFIEGSLTLDAVILYFLT
jgi:hypothetical protein